LNYFRKPGTRELEAGGDEESEEGDSVGEKEVFGYVGCM